MIHTEFSNEIRQIMWIFFRNIGLNDCKLNQKWKDYSKLKYKPTSVADQKPFNDFT